MHIQKKTILGQIGHYTASVYIAQVVTIVGSVLAKYFLGPVNSGIWTALQIILDFSKYAGMGVNSAVSLDVPYYYAKGDSDYVAKIINTVFTFLCTTSIIIGLAVIVYALVQSHSLKPELFWGLIFASVIIFLQRLNNYFVAILRAFKKFSTASRQNVYSALVNIVLIGVLASQFKIYGFLWATGLSFAFNIAYIQWKERFVLRFELRRDVLQKTIASGMPLMLYGLADTFFKSIDKFMILYFLGLQAMGLYSLGIMAANYLNSLHMSIAVVLLPHFQEKFSQNDNRKDMWGFFDHGMQGYSNVFPLLIALTWVLAPYATHTILSAFTGGLPALKWIILGIYFVSLSNLCANHLITIKERKRVLFSLFSACVFALSLGVLAIQAGGRIEAIAAVSLFSSWFYFSLLFRASIVGIYSAAKAWALYGLIMLKFALLALVLRGVDFWVLQDGSSLLRTGIAVLTVVVFNIPLWINLDRRLGLLKQLKQRFVHD